MSRTPCINEMIGEMIGSYSIYFPCHYGISGLHRRRPCRSERKISMSKNLFNWNAYDKYHHLISMSLYFKISNHHKVDTISLSTLVTNQYIHCMVPSLFKKEKIKACCDCPDSVL